MYLKALSLVLALGVYLSVGEHHDDVKTGLLLESTSRPQRSIFQSVGVQFPCSTNQDCFPADLVNHTISPGLITCDNSTGVCTCKECFILLRDKCAKADCHSYEDSKCTDDRISQKTAFLLSLFLSGLGAANFYIGQEAIAWGQLALFVATVTAVVLLICVPLCVASRVVDRNRATCCFAFFIVSTVAFIALSLIGMVCWWVADLMIFIQNIRKDGNECPLYEDL